MNPQTTRLWAARVQSGEKCVVSGGGTENSEIKSTVPCFGTRMLGVFCFFNPEIITSVLGCNTLPSECVCVLVLLFLFPTFSLPPPLILISVQGGLHLARPPLTLLFIGPSIFSTLLSQIHSNTLFSLCACSLLVNPPTISELHNEDSPLQINIAELFLYRLCQHQIFSPPRLKPDGSIEVQTVTNHISFFAKPFEIAFGRQFQIAVGTMCLILNSSKHTDISFPEPLRQNRDHHWRCSAVT